MTVIQSILRLEQKIDRSLISINVSSQPASQRHTKGAGAIPEGGKWEGENGQTGQRILCYTKVLCLHPTGV